VPTINPESNLRGLDYRAEAAGLGPPATPIIDVHTHINGHRAPLVYKQVREAFGVTMTYSMSNLDYVDSVRAALGDTVRFIAMPRFTAPDRIHAFTQGFLDDLKVWHGLGCRMCKWWTAPRGIELGAAVGDPNLLTFKNPWRRRQMDRATELGMMFMAHIADPDTWFATKYKDASVYGTKASHYEPVERLLDEYTQPWVLAHMGGWPEDLVFLAGLLDRHPNLHLDTSATKWIVRELSKHPLGEVRRFVERFKARLLFGSDIVTLDDHLGSEKLSTFAGGEKARQASSEQEAFDLYAGRYLALRTLWETNYDGDGFFADGDLNMVDPARHEKNTPARLVGQSLPPELLTALYHDNAARVVGGWWDSRR
jgi:hypothetical protein